MTTSPQRKPHLDALAISLLKVNIKVNMQQIKYTSPNQTRLPITVYYDHSCVLCRSEIENISARDLHGVLHMVDCSAVNFDASALPFDQAALLSSIHAIDSQGEWLKATDVFVVCYRAAQMQRIAAAFAFMKPLLERIYPWIARHRHVFSALGVHKLFNALTDKALRQRAARAAIASEACKGDLCEASTRK
jgi:predicted DCC family thiol-disulfide oxidoreductase YuxK